MILFAVFFISLRGLYLRYRCITCAVHRIILSVEHLCKASASFFREGNSFIRLS